MSLFRLAPLAALAALLVPAAAQDRSVLTVEPAPEAMTGTILFQDDADAGKSSRGNFRQVVGLRDDGVGFEVKEHFELCAEGDSVALETVALLDSKLRLVRQTYDLGTRRIDLYRKGKLYIRETCFPKVSEAADMREFDQPDAEVLYGLGHFLLLLRYMPLETLDGARFAKIEVNGVVSIAIDVADDQRSITYREDGRPLLIELDELGQPSAFSSTEMVFQFKRTTP